MKKLYLEQMFFIHVIEEKNGKYFFEGKPVGIAEMERIIEHYKNVNVINRPAIYDIFYYITRKKHRGNSVLVFQKQGNAIKLISGKMWKDTKLLLDKQTLDRLFNTKVK